MEIPNNPFPETPLHLFHDDLITVIKLMNFVAPNLAKHAVFMEDRMLDKNKRVFSYNQLIEDTIPGKFKTKSKWMGLDYSKEMDALLNKRTTLVVLLHDLQVFIKDKSKDYSIHLPDHKP